MLDEIMSMLEDMTETQLQNTLNYVTDEYDEEDHEDHMLEVLKKQIEVGMVKRIKLEILDNPAYDKEKCQWVMEILNAMDE